MQTDNPDVIFELKKRAKDLRKLCQEIDPFTPLSNKHQKMLNKLGITDSSDPFQLTNQLILLLEDTLEQLADSGPKTPPLAH